MYIRSCNFNFLLTIIFYFKLKTIIKDCRSYLHVLVWSAIYKWIIIWRWESIFFIKFILCLIYPVFNMNISAFTSFKAIHDETNGQKRCFWNTILFTENWLSAYVHPFRMLYKCIWIILVDSGMKYIDESVIYEWHTTSVWFWQKVNYMRKLCL